MSLPCESRLCIGCENCKNICPTKAVEIRWNEEGFLKAVNNDKCTGCGLCNSVCPAIDINTNTSDAKAINNCYIVQAKDAIRRNSSSGGTFAALAIRFIEKGGYVFGAAWKEDFSVEHVMIDDVDSLGEIQSSKYIQSKLNDTFIKVKDLLEKGETVLFSGTPCQIAALKQYLKDINLDKLYTIDFWCHGISSKKVLDKYLSEIYPNREPISVCFRSKSFYGWSCNMHVEFADGTKSDIRMDEDLWWRCYLSNIMLGEQCADKCLYKNSKADLTLADFWGLRYFEEFESIDDGRGTSAVIVNSDKGNGLLTESQDLFRNLIRSEIGVVGKGNIVDNPILVDVNKRCRFFKMIESHRLDDSFSIINTNHYDVGIVGLWFTGNYGGALTGWALNRIIEDLGYSTVFIDFEKGRSLASASGKVESYIREKCVISRTYKDSFDLLEANNLCDTFLIGSDQCWRSWFNTFYDYNLYLNFANADKRLLSYATSLESEFIDANSEEQGTIGRLLRRFDAISVRERKSLAFLKDNYNIDASFTLDPILMLNEKQWTLFFDDNTDAFKATGTSEYIGCYFLDITESSVDYLNRLEKLLERNTIVLRGTDSSNIYGYEFPDEIVDASLPEMVKFIKNASFILTDSYHGCCISIAFHVPFIAIINERRGGSRFRSLLNELGLHDRMVSIGDNDKLCLGEIDWQDVDKRLACLKRSSENWLQEALSCGIKERNPIEEQWLKFSIMEMCLHETQKKADIAYAYANELRNKIVKPREKRIVDYIEKEIPQGAIVAYRGGGYHTACLDSILRPLFVKKNIEVIGIIDRGNTKLGLGYTYYQPSDSILNNIEYLILSSAKYRNEMINEKNEMFHGKYIDIYEIFGDELAEGQAYYEV